MNSESSDRYERPEDEGTDGEGVVRRWLSELELAEKAEENWRGEAAEVIDTFNGKKAKDETFNILYANTMTLGPAIYAKPPVPDIRRRYRDKDPTGREAAKILERGISYVIDSYDFDHELQEARKEYLLPGRGVIRVRYHPVMQTERIEITMVEGPEGPQYLDPEGFESEYEEDDDGLFRTEEYKAFEEVSCEFVSYLDYLQCPAPSWSDVRWVAFRHLMTRDELEEAFKDGSEVNLDWQPGDDDSKEAEDALKRAKVWEIWDKDGREVVWIAEGWKKAPLRVDDDPLQLRDFFPCPRPIYSLPVFNDGVPKPEFKVYEAQAKELSQVSAKIADLTEQIKVAGIYDSSSPEIADLITCGNKEMIGSQNYAAISDKGIAAFVTMWDNEPIAKVLVQLYQNRDQIKEVIYEITGISDIVRGQSKATETATAQNIKAQWGSLRIQDRQKEFQRFIRDIIRIKAEIMAEHFSQRTLSLMTGVEVSNEVMTLIKDDALRGFRIDIETDSTILGNQDAEQENITNLLGAVVQFVQGIAPAVQAQMFPAEVAKSLLLLAVRRFRGAREVEEAIAEIEEGDGGMEALQQQLMQMQQQAEQALAQKDQEIEAVKADKSQEVQMKAAESQQRLQADTAIKTEELQHKQALSNAEMQADIAKTKMKIDADLSLQKYRIDQEIALKREQFHAEQALRPKQEKAA